MIALVGLLKKMFPAVEVMLKLPIGNNVPVKVTSPVEWIDPEIFACCKKETLAADVMVKMEKGASPTFPEKVMPCAALNVIGDGAGGGGLGGYTWFCSVLLKLIAPPELVIVIGSQITTGPAKEMFPVADADPAIVACWLAEVKLMVCPAMLLAVKAKDWEGIEMTG